MLGQTLSLHSHAPKICVLRLSAIGDVCHAVAMIQQLQRDWPKAEITWVIGKLEQRLLEGLPGVSFVVFDKSAGLGAYRALRSQFSGHLFDVLLHMQVALRSSIASLCIPAKKRIGFDRSRAKEGQWLFTDSGVEPRQHPHVLEGFLDFAKAIGVQTTAPSWDMPLDEDAELWAEENFLAGCSYAVICAGASKAERNWMADRYAALADHLHAKGFRIVLCGGPADIERRLARDIESHASCSMQNIVGKTNLKQLLSILKRARVVIAPDTGPAHMAVTVGTPVVGLYAHSNPRRTGPYLYQNYVASVYEQSIEKQFSKSWTQLPWGQRAKGSDLMENISLELVIEKVEAILADFYPEC